MGTPVPYPGHTPDPNLRISDADRHKVAEFLREAAGEGRLEIDELEERIEATYKAKTYADLVPITADLPLADQPQPAVTLAKPAAGARPDLYAATPVHSAVFPLILSGVQRKGEWTVPATVNVVALMGGGEFDMRQAQFSARETVFNANAIMGGVNIIVGPEVRVIMEVIGILGGSDGPDTAESEPDGPVLRVRGIALMGGVAVERKLPKKARKQLR
ncbi:MAG: DUF1707 and DUF2154 domain-containing protein [Nocardioides sp.]|nr:DUF1707 and DUF2154 domain-containing protein [Nocardioides sp.]